MMHYFLLPLLGVISILNNVDVLDISNHQAAHDFHSTLMSMQYNKATKSFEMELTIETDHFEYALNKHFITDVHLGENKELDNSDDLITAYLNQTIQLVLNKKPVILKVSNKLVDYNVTTIEFEPIPFKKRVKHITMKNNMMFAYFPQQQNLVQIFYKQKKATFLFGGDVVKKTISL